MLLESAFLTCMSVIYCSLTSEVLSVFYDNCFVLLIIRDSYFLVFSVSSVRSDFFVYLDAECFQL